MEEILKILGLATLSGLKFFLGVPATVAAGYSFIPTMLITSIGGIAGFFVFFYIGEIKWIRYYFGKLMDWIFNLLGLERAQKQKKKFSKTNRLIVTVKGKYGLIGLALLTPCLFSIPLGSLLAARYFDDNKATIPYMILSIIFSSFVLTSFYQIF